MSAFTWPSDSSSAGLDWQQADGQIQAAVLVPLFIAGDTSEPYVVLTKRRADLRRHAGEISFPGGRKDDEDDDLSATALREADEEIGLNPSQVQLLGSLPTTSTFATNYVIHPFVATIPAGTAWTPSVREVDEVLELPLAEVRAAKTITDIERRGITFQTDAYIIEGRVIWGATARILAYLFDALLPPDAEGNLALASATP
ncbi:MAG TPA: CoA pyrophosphatase [Solirubrobacteraceae bacterium]|nr:CoA pyrophosphatase [Solirubrobacteraceae bacterium]